MADITKGLTFTPTDSVTNDKLHDLVDLATVTNIVQADMASGTALITTSGTEPTSPTTDDFWQDTDEILRHRSTADSAWRTTMASTFRGYINGYETLSVDNSDVVTILPGNCLDSTNQYVYRNASSSTIDMGVLGAGGVDVSPAVDGLYHSFIISDKAGTMTPTGLASLSLTAPLMPSGYDIFRNIGALYYDSAGVGGVVPFAVHGAGKFRHHIYHHIDGAWNKILSLGTATTLTGVDASSHVHTNAHSIDLFSEGTNPASGADNNISHDYRTNGFSADFIENSMFTHPVAAPAALEVKMSFENNIPSADTSSSPLIHLFKYIVSSTNNLSIWVRGFWYNIGGGL